MVVQSLVAVSDSCNPMDCSPPGSSVRGILQARTLEWVAIDYIHITILHNKMVNIYNSLIKCMQCLLCLPLSLHYRNSPFASDYSGEQKIQTSVWPMMWWFKGWTHGPRWAILNLSKSLLFFCVILWERHSFSFRKRDVEIRFSGCQWLCSLEWMRPRQWEKQSSSKGLDSTLVLRPAVLEASLPSSVVWVWSQ